MLYHGLTANVERIENVTPTHIVTYPFQNSDDCDEFIALIDKQTPSCVRREGTETGGIKDQSLRECGIEFISYDHANPDNVRLFERLFYFTNFYNKTFFNFDAFGFNYLQYTLYDKEGSHYDWHKDMFDDRRESNCVHRKLSFSLILSDPEDYEGGVFEVAPSGKAEVLTGIKKGTMIMFPSYIPHRVSPVLSGVRKSLVWWLTGPKFR
jgi:PKHD-type hydroxylase